MLTAIETIAKRKSYLLGLLEAVGRGIDLSDTQYEEVRKSYGAIAQWLAEAPSPALRAAVIYPQGSIRLQTVVRPLTDDEFDVDLVCHLRGLNMGWNPANVKKLVGDRLKEHDRYRTMLVEKNRCWQLQYAGQYHLDVTPSITNPHCHNGGELVPDKSLRLWKATNPIAYAERFEARAKLQPRYRLFEAAKIRADIEGLPEPQEFKGALKRAVQICKRHRDVYFLNRDSSLAPISIIITTLLAWSYESCVRSNSYDHDLDVLFDAVRGMPQFIEVATIAGQPHYVIPNETTEGENFAEKWNEDPRRAKAFFEWHTNAVHTLEEFVTLRGEDVLSKHLSEAFGGSVVAPVFAEINRSVNAARAAGRLGIGAALGVSTSAASTLVKANTFYGWRG